MDKPRRVGTFMAVQELNCPHCAALLDWHSVAGRSRRPEPGNHTICFRCGGLCVFVASPFGLDLAIRAATDAELAEAQRHEQFRQLRAARLESYHPFQALALVDEVPEVDSDE